MRITPAPIVSKPYIVSPSGWDNGWKAAKAASAATPANVLVMGDSYTWGALASDIPAKSWPMLLRASLQAAYGRYGDFYHAAWSNDYNGYAGTGTTFTGTSPWTTILTTNRGYANRGFGKGLYWSSGFAGAGSNPCVFTTPVACTAIDIITQDNTTATYGYTVDGGGVQTVSATNGGWLRRTSITGLASTTHTITFDNQSTGTGLVIFGIVCYSGNAGGVAFANVSATGGSMLDILGRGATAAPELYLQGKVTAVSVSTTTGNAVSPIVVTTSVAHQMKSGGKVTVAAVGGNTNANGSYYVATLSPTTLALYTDRTLTTPVAGNGAYTSGGTVTPITGFGFPAQPHLAIVSYGINDCQNFYGVEGFRQSYKRTIQGLRRGNPECSVVVVANCMPDQVNSETTSGFNQPQNWQFYMDSLYTLAGDFNCAFVDLHAKWGELGVTYGFQTAANAHPTDAGHGDIAAVLASIL